LRREEFTAALNAGASRGRRHLVLIYRPNGLPLARIGIITGTRVAPRAVDRNRVKRVVREAFRKVRHRLVGWDIVVQLRRLPTAAGTRRLATEIDKLLEELAGEPRDA
jgi:ribonuclease P protein component